MSAMMDAVEMVWPSASEMAFPRSDDTKPGAPVLEALAMAVQPWSLTPIFRTLRHAGWPIPKKAEAEYAAALHFLVGHALRHGENWRTSANAELNQMINAASAARETK